MWKRSWIKRGIKRRNGQAEWQKEKLNGRTEEKTEIAKNLIKLGINVDNIVKATGLSKEEIEKLTEDK